MREEGGIKGGMGRDADGSRDRFPIGMRVLAVDDDPTCLRILQALLLRCQYHVTITNQAITALNLLRGNKDKFDLVISDVHMPDMDGFKLLELVGLEMDLPVIMLSVNGETKTVMKGITHGACDYLLKPVRIEELRNIWQHVVRRKFNQRERNNTFDFNDEYDKTPSMNSEHGLCQITSASSDHNGKLNKKRKDQSSEDEDEGEENAQENEDPSALKKPRVVWSVELHRKFVAAVNQLGIDKAVPKRILELMNVDRLTRENVASHLQKYRLYLKRLSIVASHQASIVAAFGGRDPSFLHTWDGFQSYNALAASCHLPSLASFQSSRALSKTNMAGIEFHDPAPSGTVQFGCIDNILSNPIDKFQLIGLPGNQQGSLLEEEHMKPQNWMHKVTNNLPDFTSTPLLPQAPLECTRSKLVIDSSMRMPSMSSEPFQESVRVSFPTNNKIGANSTVSKKESIPSNISSCNSVVSPTHNAKGECSLFCGVTSLLPVDVHEGSKLLSFTDPVDYKQEMEGWKKDRTHDSNLLSSSFLSSQLPVDIVTDCAAPIETQTLAPHYQNDALASDDQLKHEDEYVSGIPKMQGGFGSNACSFDGLLNSIIKLERDDISFTDGDIGCDFCPLGACI